MLFLLRINATPEERSKAVERIIARYVIAEAKARRKQLNQAIDEQKEKIKEEK